MILNGIEHCLGHLSTCSIVEEYEVVTGIQRRKRLADPGDRKIRHGFFSVVSAAGRWFLHYPRRSLETGDTGGSRCTSPYVHRDALVPSRRPFLRAPEPA